MDTAKAMTQHLLALADPAIAEHSQRFFRTGPGDYGEGDRFLGIRVPHLRKQVSACSGAPLREVSVLLKSRWHEARLLALLILVRQFSKADESGREAIVKVYLSHTNFINNWDLVDSSAHQIVGTWFLQRDRSPLRRLAQSISLWERRIAIIATYHWIKQNEFADTLEIAEMLLNDQEDLIHKAVGWMLREVGNRDGKVERSFLRKHYKVMPRTMLRYAIEKFPEAERKGFLNGTI